MVVVVNELELLDQPLLWLPFMPAGHSLPSFELLAPSVAPRLRQLNPYPYPL
jgi:hypothetical protein